jgi:hypothetical protein
MDVLKARGLAVASSSTGGSTMLSAANIDIHSGYFPFSCRALLLAQ